MPATPYTYAQRGEAYCQKGDIEKCVADFDRPCASTPTTHRSRICAASRAPTRAMRTAPSPILQRRSSWIQEAAPTTCAAAGIYEAKGDKARAAADYRNALKIDPTTRRRSSASKPSANKDVSALDQRRGVMHLARRIVEPDQQGVRPGADGGVRLDRQGKHALHVAPRAAQQNVRAARRISAVLR